jgi:curved DNA-binding protein CbpA
MVKSTMNKGNRARDYYFILNVTSNASASEIRRAYRRLALECHPDHHPEDPGAEEKFKLISEAYSVLENVQKRREYDSQHDTQSLLSNYFDKSIHSRYQYTG